MRAYMLALLCVGAALICGCQVTSSFNDAMLEPGLNRIAVMPFDGPAGDPELREMVRRSIHDNLSVLGYADMKPGEVDYRLAQAGIRSDEISIDNATELARVLDVDALLFGKITKATNLTAIVYSETQIAGEFCLVDARSGETIWKAAHCDGQRGGAFLHMLCLFETITDQMANMKEDQAYRRAADKLARKVIDTMPDAAGDPIATAPLPQIISVRTSADDTGIETGKRIVVVMNGSPGMTATVNLCGIQDYIPMTEAPAGVYTGAYMVNKHLRDTNGTIIFRIQDRSGNVVQRTVRVGRTLASK